MLMERDVLRTTLKEDAEQGNGEILEENDAGFLYYDNEYAKEVQFTLQENMTDVWLAEKIYINPVIKKDYILSEKEVAQTLMNNLPSEHFITLNKIFVVYEKADYKEISKRLYGEEEDIGIDFDDFFENGIGIMDFADNSVFINMKNIEKNNREIFGDAPHLIDEENEYGFWSTAFHELRHLMLDTNMFLDEKEYPNFLAAESEVEKFGNMTAENMKKGKANVRSLKSNGKNEITLD